MTGLFGTDGVRGLANKELSCDVAFKLGQAAVANLGNNIVVGKDTRLSGDMLESAVAAGIMSMGGTALLAGVIPTPAVAVVVRELYADGGIVISASHNPPEYNGIKFFDAQGFKLPDDKEAEIEGFVNGGGAIDKDMPSGDAVGVALQVENAAEIYIEFVVKSIENQKIDFKGYKVALDVGHGASAYTSLEALKRLGAEVFVINDEFCGTDINVECGSTCLKPLRDLMEESKADIGIAHDGDADRVMMVSSDGKEIDGDMIEAVCALDMKSQGKLTHNTVVTTVMCNLGFVRAMQDNDIEIVQTKVGDRYVLEAMLENGHVIGGEQSGHVILLDHNTTGDGLLVACHFLAACKRSGKSINDAVAIMKRFPQALINVCDVDKQALSENQVVKECVFVAEEKLGDSGRVLVRPSGTEPVIRVMVEATEESIATQIAAEIAQTIENELRI